MKSFYLLFLTIFSLQLIAQQPPRKLKYIVTASLNDREHTLDGLMQLYYYNNSADTLKYIWFHIYPNAFKTDRTAFSEYMLGKGTTAFYFSDKDKRGYINRLNFQSGDQVLKQEDHPLYIDIIKVLLNTPLAPGDSVSITTPFHVKVPYNFDGIGYKFPEYHLRYWFPSVAEYINHSWLINPLTDADNVVTPISDYEIALRVPAKFKVEAPALEPSFSPEIMLMDSVKMISYNASGLNDFHLRIIKPHSASSLQKQKIRPGNDGNLSGDTGAIYQKLKKIFSRQLLPAIGYNDYDGFMLGLLSHNFHKKESKFNYYVAPVYTFNSNTIAGIGGASYRFYPGKFVDEAEVGATGSTFSYNDGTDSIGNKVFARLFRIVPFIRVKFPTRSAKIDKTLTFKSYILNEKDLEFAKYSVDSMFYPTEGEYVTRFVNELTFDYSSGRILYPYNTRLQVQQGLTWFRLNATGNYFFNYPKGGGVNVRVFASKFGYIGSLSSQQKFSTMRYQPKLTAVRGFEDFTYSDYFIGRNNFEGFTSHQVMMRDGGLKLRTDLFEGLQGRSDNWIASINFTSTFPQIFPFHMPLKIFLDAGTYSEAWDPENPNPRFLYVAGLQLGLLKDHVNIYVPLFYSKQFRDSFKTVPEENTFVKRISFSIDLHRFSPRAFFK